jgi:hypothetical protein
MEITIQGENHTYHNRENFSIKSKEHEEGKIIFLYETADPNISEKYINIENLMYRGVYHLIVGLPHLHDIETGYIDMRILISFIFSVSQSLNCFKNDRQTYDLLSQNIEYKILIDELCEKYNITDNITDKEIQELPFKENQFGKIQIYVDDFNKLLQIFITSGKTLIPHFRHASWRTYIEKKNYEEKNNSQKLLFYCISRARSFCMMENIEKYITENPGKNIYCLVGDEHRKHIQEQSKNDDRKYNILFAQNIKYIPYVYF